jgi:membrane protein DedA with SNARE-associated domain
MTAWVIAVVSKLSYFGIAVLTFLENAFPPIPSELIMPLAGYAASEGDVSLAGAIVAGSAGSILGAIGWYLVGRRVGEKRLRAWVERHGRWITLDPEDLDRSQDWLRRHGAAVVFFGRLIPGLRTWVSLPAGLSGMNFPVFLLYSSAGTVIWTALLTYAGHYLGESYDAVDKYVGGFSAVICVAIASWYVFRLVQGKGKKRTARDSQSPRRNSQINPA